MNRLQTAVTRRSETDYMFDFWTALGWTILTCGIYSLYVVYRLFWRSVEHNNRRLEVLDSARLLAWERAVASGRGDELTPRFQVLGSHLGELRRLTTEFRDPVIWTIIVAISSGVGQIIGHIFLDLDLVRHERAEQAAELELEAIFGALGVSMAATAAAPPKGQHNYIGRIVATLATCGIYALWWVYNLMIEGNEHQRRNWASDDALWTAAGSFG
ncbi:MAG: hypothetical protein WD691_03875 [Acidimicrobiales bacterium]